MKRFDMAAHEQNNEPSSPACSMHEFADELLPRPGRESPDWPIVQTFRRALRAELLARRNALELDARKRNAESVTQRLRAAVDLRAYSTLGFYWPIRGELDLRALARSHVEAGGTAALPVVVAKNAPVELWLWQHGAPMQRGFWNIPVPAERRVVKPDVLVIPLVGYDAAGFRLGYGGGYYDRTLASLVPRPFCIGVGFDDAELETIHPQPHDIPMDLIVTERRVLPFAR